MNSEGGDKGDEGSPIASIGVHGSGPSASPKFILSAAAGGVEGPG
jgi:hypothetical protein